ncbi:ribosomal protection-like ABC-F family protein [Desulfoferrobacter suflitae]|uniref:ribosomal protection-like ABC-F family protein n=1 Tax=Desulfoferrobacter suflitae TaxID=2865782 RepID=UPI0021641FEC|nr:ABC-F family ATP-binding cassette domain-containing protein [Desulfoferrobacter suflitae]MCK8602451.1 ATP-binding cassette domain-containing protein [Desulfoferrobacter suflitae]
MIAVQQVSKFLGKKELFKEVSFHVHGGERVGLIGTNGAGKTTLFHILLGETEPDEGIVTKAKHLSIGYLPQQCQPPEKRSILAHATDVDQKTGAVRAELNVLQKDMAAAGEPSEIEALVLRQAHLLEQLEHLGGYDLEARAGKILSGLGFHEHQFGSPAATLSGGWVMRLELARLLLSEPDLLLLDEPTNHLDLESLIWLEQYLLSSASAVIVVSHDRAFLNRVVTRILELEGGRLSEYVGNFDFYASEKMQRRQIQLASYKNQQERIRQVERFIDRNRCRKDKARQVQSRIKSLQRMERIEVSAEQSQIHFEFPQPPRSGKRVLELRNVSKAYGDHVIYEGVNLVIEKGDRIAFLGKNGAGKSTLLKILAGREPLSTGERILGHNVALGYYAQYQWEQLAADKCVLDEAASVAGDLPHSRLRGLLGAFLFRGDDVEKRIAVLSGGEKARLILCKLLLQRPNVLLMDEPTNHLDIPSRDVLEEALQEFPGTLCFISHDRHFLNSLCNKVLAVENGRIHLFPGNYDDFVNVWQHRLLPHNEAAPGSEQTPQDAVSSGARRAQQQKRLEARWRNELYRLKKPLQEKLERADAELDELHRLLDSLNEQLGNPDTYQQGQKVQQLQIEYQQCQKDIGRLTQQWEAIALQLEELEENFWKEREIAACSSG